MLQEVDEAEDRFAAFHARFAPFFFCVEVRERSRRYLRALLGSIDRKNGWQLAEAVGEHDPDGAQHLLFEAVWDEDAMRDELERFVAEQFGDPEAGNFVLDESACPEKGTKSVGVKRRMEAGVPKDVTLMPSATLSLSPSRSRPRSLTAVKY